MVGFQLNFESGGFSSISCNRHESFGAMGDPHHPQLWGRELTPRNKLCVLVGAVSALLCLDVLVEINVSYGMKESIFEICPE